MPLVPFWVVGATRIRNIPVYGCMCTGAYGTSQYRIWIRGVCGTLTIRVRRRNTGPGYGADPYTRAFASTTAGRVRACAGPHAAAAFAFAATIAAARARREWEAGERGAKGKSGVLFRAVEYCRWLEEGVEALRLEVERVEILAGVGKRESKSSSVRFSPSRLSLDPNAFFIPASPLHQLIPFDSNSTVPFFVPRRFPPFHPPLTSTFAHCFYIPPRTRIILKYNPNPIKDCRRHGNVVVVFTAEKIK
ncbi:hypothetical protein M422DRAFT_274207 [Sphaerobolus stellatus SS14]|uniref:Uncharacterized protein n=1 Tax=Sphaerobolus stellatus (strain SS14) TaxID=990650 RepID=A0A0C9U774_SPHS4|nr:hypothetical protein M422DRAFT_274207 [Sphaerobolus stellatus SS14]